MTNTKEFQSVLDFDPLIRNPLQQVSISAINIIRANFPDSFWGQGIPSQHPVGVIPYDVDDLDVPTSMIKNWLDEGKTNNEILSLTKEVAINNNELNWQSSLLKSYPDKLIRFVQDLRDKYCEQNKFIFESVQQFETDKNKRFLIQNVASGTMIRTINLDMSFGNEASVDISLIKLRENGESLQFIPKENDVLEIKFRYQDGKEQTVFLGLITGISFVKQYGQITMISLVIYGISKMLLLNKMVTDRAIIDQFTKGELAQVGITPWASGAFTNKRVDQIFDFIMMNLMGMKMGNSDLNKASELASLNGEGEKLISLIDNVEAVINLNGKKFKDGGKFKERIANQTIDKENKLTRIQVFIQLAIRGKIGLITDIDAEIQKIESELTDIDFTQYIQAKGPYVTTIENARQITAQYFLREAMKARLTLVNQKIQLIRNDSTISKGDEIRLNYVVDPDAFESVSLFQTIYIPLITWAALRKDRGDITARFRGKQAVAFDLALRSSFNLFFSQLQTPAEVLESLRKNAKFQVYENENGQIIAEIPRYNEFNAEIEEGETIDDFILTNPIKSEVVRQDANLTTRIDVKEFVPLVGALPYTLTARQYTDISVLSKYGMRAEAPVYNPNAISVALAQLYAALEVTIRNAQTRTIQITYPADRKFKLGRLYFLAVVDLENQVGEFSQHHVIWEAGKEGTNRNRIISHKLTDSDGYVGYLTKIQMSVDYSSMTNCILTFSYVRKAKLVMDDKKNKAANFKILPDLGTLIDVLEKARESGDLSEDSPQMGVTSAEQDPATIILGGVYWSEEMV
jgi:hypothetical protein